LNKPDAWVALQLSDLAEALRRTGDPPPVGIHLRAVDLEADLAAIAEVYNAAYGLEGAEAITPHKVARFTWHPGLRATGAFLALEGERAVGLGVGSVEVLAPGAGARRGARAHQGAVELLAVRPEYRRRGLGRALLHAVLGWLAGQGVRVVRASAEDAPALLLLQRYGFVPVPL
jgi:GNAT superfamily N-acetyltransferase